MTLIKNNNNLFLPSLSAVNNNQCASCAPLLLQMKGGSVKDERTREE
jgi:hypothetical protein